MKVLIRSNWGPFIGTDYVEALGVYDSLDAAMPDALQYAHDKWEPDDDEDNPLEDEGPDVVVEEYNPLTHDDERAGGGSFADDFARMTH